MCALHEHCLPFLCLQHLRVDQTCVGNHGRYHCEFCLSPRWSTDLDHPDLELWLGVLVTRHKHVVLLLLPCLMIPLFNDDPIQGMRTECPWCPISQRMSCSRNGSGTTMIPCPTERWNFEMGARDCNKSAVLHDGFICMQTICTTWTLVAQVSHGVAERDFLGNRKSFAPGRGMAGRPAVEALWETSHESLWS